MITRKKNNPILFFVTSASATMTLAAALSADVTEAIEDNTDIGVVDDDGHFYIPHEGNSTLSATFSIRVTPEHYHIFSWTILWVCFVSAVAFGMRQVKMERRWLKHTILSSASSNSSSSRYGMSKRKLGSPTDPELGGNRKNYTRAAGRLVRSSSRPGGSRDRMTQSASTASINSTSASSGDEQQAVSSGDLARATFRRLILFAMTSRTIAIPIQIYSDPLWIQLIADTFPVMTFATVWMWLVSFFIQLVGVALGTNVNVNVGTPGGSSNGPGGTPNSSNSPSAYRPVATIDTVIQITAYCVYAFLIISFTIFRRIAAAVLLYALLCCVYATLLGMGMYFCPRLLGLLLPSLGGKWKSPLAVRLMACSSIVLLVFAAQTLSFARKVVQSTVPSSHKGDGPYWWFHYGALELLPGILFFILLPPKSIPSETLADNEAISKSPPPPTGRRTPPLHGYHRRVDSGDSRTGSGRQSSSPMPSRSPPPPPIRQQQQYPGASGLTKESTPLLSTHSGLRYGGPTPSAALGGSHTDVTTSAESHTLQQSNSDRSTTST